MTAVLGVLLDRLSHDTDPDRAVAALRGVAGVLSARLRGPDEPPAADERAWPAGPDRMLGVVLDGPAAAPEADAALACLAAALGRQGAEDRLARVAHDLSTPLTPIVAYAGMLTDPDTGPLNPAQRQCSEVIERNALKLTRMLADLPAGARRTP